MSRFFVESNQVNENIITILGEDVNHIKNVLRIALNTNIEIVVKDLENEVFLAKIIEMNNEKITCDIIEKIETKKEADIELSIFQGLPKSDKMELIIQKCTELGVSNIFPLELKNCVVKLDEKDIQKKLTRWQKIAEVASKQCLRDRIPTIENKVNLKELCGLIESFDLVLVAYEKEVEGTLKDVLYKNNKAKKIAIVVGPEGGFDIEEIKALKENGASIVKLGNRILRTETAPIALSSIVMYELGDIGGF